ncbi:hypothetical protein B0H14DRAFT_2556580 [Mycena olivaceomarginata]|nr:hypothetical protein B0H14DRAFT_2556580 [Mycena olivaceomarginata]
MPSGTLSTHLRCTARNHHQSVLLVHYRCLPLQRGWDLCGHECNIEGAVQLGQWSVVVPLCATTALVNAAAPDRCCEQRRGAAALPIHRWGAVFCGRAGRCGARTEMAVQTPPCIPTSPQLGATRRVAYRDAVVIARGVWAGAAQLDGDGREGRETGDYEGRAATVATFRAIRRDSGMEGPGTLGIWINIIKTICHWDAFVSNEWLQQNTSPSLFGVYPAADSLAANFPTGTIRTESTFYSKPPNLALDPGVQCPKPTVDAFFAGGGRASDSKTRKDVLEKLRECTGTHCVWAQRFVVKSHQVAMFPNIPRRLFACTFSIVVYFQNNELVSTLNNATLQMAVPDTRSYIEARKL